MIPLHSLLTNDPRCYPESEIKLKTEPCFGTEKCTVSWHADSSLEHFSTIAVYHVTTPISGARADQSSQRKHKKSKKEKNSDQPADSSSPVNDANVGGWRVSLRVWPDAEGPTAGKTPKNLNATALKAVPAVSVPLPNQSTYYLLDDFNHHHQHSGSSKFLF